MTNGVRPIRACGLCGEVRQLARSHALPKSLYRLCRADGEANPNPVIVTERAHQATSYQYVDYFLCDECEGRFDKQGEKWTMARCFRGKGKFVLRDLFKGLKPNRSFDGVSQYSPGAVEGIDSSQLIYFASSVFWRAAARPWKVRFHQFEPLKLGPLAQGLRSFLLGKESFPANCSLSVQVDTEIVPILATHFPVGSRTDVGGRDYSFYIPGVEFRLATNTQNDPKRMNTCFVRGEGNSIFISDKLNGTIRGRFLRGMGQVESANRKRRLLQQGTIALRSRPLVTA
jgi:hypothetical protein